MANIGTSPIFTTTEAVRAALGVDATDIKDQQILDAQLDVELALDLGTWCTGYATKLNPGGTPTPEQETLKSALLTYCKWFCALEFTKKPLAVLQLYGDGKAEQRRFTNFEWDALVANATGKVLTYKNLVLSLDPDGTPPDPTAFYGIMGAVEPTYDPVTNEGAE